MVDEYSFLKDRTVDIFRSQRTIMEAGGQRVGDPSVIRLYIRLIEEEFNELMESAIDDAVVWARINEAKRRGALSDHEIDDEFLDMAVETIDALCDIIVVCAGALNALGVDGNALMREVYASNDSKIVDGKLVRRGDGKVLKGPNFFPPDLASVVKGIEPDHTPVERRMAAE